MLALACSRILLRIIDEVFFFAVAPVVSFIIDASAESATYAELLLCDLFRVADKEGDLEAFGRFFAPDAMKEVFEAPAFLAPLLEVLVTTDISKMLPSSAAVITS